MSYQIADVKKEINKRILEKSYYHFFKESWSVLEPSTELIDAPYIKYLCDRLQYHCEFLIRGESPEIDLLIINIPPSTSKSSIVTKFLTPWLWLRNPALQIANSSYSSTLSNSHCVNSRTVITSSWYQSMWGDRFKLRYDQNTKSKFETDKTGVRMATSTGAGVTGFHFHLFIQDDPLNPQQAASKVKIESAKTYNDQTIPSRILENGFQITVMQRLHEEDPTGHELRGEEKQIEHICLPATNERNVRPVEALDLYDKDGLLTPRLDSKKLAIIKERLGSYGYSAQYDQDPVPEGGGIIKKEWFEYCTESELPTDIVWDMWIDGAYTKSTKNDPTGIMVAGYSPKNKKAYARYFAEKYMEMPELLKAIPSIAEEQNLRNKSRVRFEPKASGKSLKQMVVANTTLSAVEIRGSLVNEGKEARIQVAAPKVEASRWVLVKGNWNDKFVSQICAFPNAAHDEAVDLIGYASDEYFKPKKKGITRRN